MYFEVTHFTNNRIARGLLSVHVGLSTEITFVVVVVVVVVMKPWVPQKHT